nr:CerR family C-terminal domain-containing protein [uncultured Moellerella sp.]
MKNADKNQISSEQTKENLINEGIRLFAQLGISGVRTRQLAEAAGVNQSAIPYHLGGKLGVYSACINKIATELAETIDIASFDRQLQMAEQQAPQEIVQKLLPCLIEGLGRALLSPEKWVYSQLIIREQIEPTENFKIIYQQFIEPLHLRLTQLIRLVDKSTAENSESVIIKAHAIIGQILGFVIARKAFLLRIDKESMSDKLVEDIIQQIIQLSLKAIKD